MMTQQNIIAPVTAKKTTPKAAGKAERLRKRRGRPRLEGVAREPNGRKSRRKVAVSARESARAEDTRSVAVEARIRHGIPKEWAHLPQAGSALGRVTLMFPQRLEPHHVEAGERLALDYARYYALSGIPFPSPRAANLFYVHGAVNNHDDPQRTRKAASRVMALERVLGMADVAGRPVTRLVKQVCVLDDDGAMRFEHMVAFLKKGLEALATFYNIAPQRIFEHKTPLHLK